MEALRPEGRHIPDLREVEDRILHPYIRYISNRLRALLQIVELEHDGSVVEFDGFRLRELSTWVRERQSKLLHNFGSLSGYCNVRCNFCYEMGNPLPYDLTMLGVPEAATRARYFDAASGRGLIQFSERLDLEPFTNPHLLEILSVYRAHDPSGFINLTTNGARLDEPMLAGLAALGPVHLIISINNSDPRGRREIMHDQRSAVAVQAIRRIRDYGIPYTGGIVAWPDLPDDELRNTIHFLDENMARAIRVSLPSYSGYFSGDRILFDTDAEWDRFFAIVEEEAERIETPITAAPYLPRGVPILPRVSGVIRNSPAAGAGIRRGDLVVSVGGRQVTSRMHCKRLLVEMARHHGGVVTVELQRGSGLLSRVLDDRLDSEADLYPYKPKGYPSPSAMGDSSGSLLGLFLNDDIDPENLLQVIDIAHKHEARTVLVMTSRLLEDVVITYFTQNPTIVEASRDLEISVISPRHGFWGGNIVVGDLYLCQDYIDCLQRFKAKLGRVPDLAVIPATFSPNNWMDLAGTSYAEIEIQTGVPVELVPCSQIVI